MRVVLDTIVLVSAIFFGGLPRRILDVVMSGEVQLVTTTELLDEFEGVLTAKFGFTLDAARTTRGEFEALAEIVHPHEIPRVCRDPDDDLFLAGARSGGCDEIISGDGDLLSLGTYRGSPS